MSRPMDPDIFNNVKDILNGRLGIDTAFLKPESTWDDLGLDSLDKVELLMGLEDEMRITIEDEKAEKVNNVAELCDLIAECQLTADK